VILPFKGHWPRIHETAFIAPSADIVGDVEIGSHSSVWFQCVVRGDVHSIRIGSRTNVQDLTMLHCTRKKSPLVIGDEVTIGHRVVLHGCTIGNRVLVGMGAVVMDDAVVGDDCIIGAGALVTQGSRIPDGSLAVGSPAKVVRKLKPAELEFLKKSAENYVGDSIEYHGVVPGPPLMGRNDLDLETMGSDEEEDYGKDAL
jgi:carbonic anhydrase/acetyltransferase-like protein (isoleucine patch superfamily)